ncbi:SgcJ/EcaC family oxidoreductase [Telluribacter sp.]|jgi:uncharacterized protein (TIGR02246 family)|uniref:SgcJ/EcaC family oxidoreductase n=1 Tax=Telluribacter sp. TaxID=1978767 RepID=UPI002E0D3CCF|nr:SgcJ/EcaC family oxidoreductase [Telluribacter sp.]
MNRTYLFAWLMLFVPMLVQGQSTRNAKQERAIIALIDNYSLAREKQDTVLLKSILTTDIDQLVSSGEWREGIKGSMAGMVRSTDTNPGTRTLKVERVRFLNPESAVVDARYTIQNPNGTTRQMWSTFVVVSQKGNWKITAIRNMLPAGTN